MYVKTQSFSGGNNTPDGTVFVERELIEEYEGEIVEQIIFEVTQTQALPEEITFDGYVILVSEHLTNNQINILNEMLIASNEWTTEQIEVILENVK